MHDALLETLRSAQRFGFFGPGPVEAGLEHARGFERAIGPVAPGTRLVDLGSGGGLPGLVLAAAWPHASITLVERRQKRSDFLQRAVRGMRWEHVEVVAEDVAVVVADVAAARRPAFDVVTARGFGPPEATLRTGVVLVRPGGRVAISEPPTGDRWDPELVASLGATSERHDGVRVFTIG